MPQFSSDWFSDNIASWKHLFGQLGWDPNSPRTAIEIGCFEGRATLWTLEHVLCHPESRIYCVDLFTPTIQNPDPRALFMSNMGSHAKRVEALAGRSFERLTLLYLRGVRADFIYVDGSHYGSDVLDDLVLSFKLAKVGGLIICDDYLWRGEDRGSEDVLNSPKIAVDAFTTIFRRKLEIPARQPLYQFAFVKTGD